MRNDCAGSAPMPAKAPAMVMPAFNWTGFYIGGHVGGARQCAGAPAASSAADRPARSTSWRRPVHGHGTFPALERTTPEHCHPSLVAAIVATGEPTVAS